MKSLLTPKPISTLLRRSRWQEPRGSSFLCVPHGGKAVCHESKTVYDPLEKFRTKYSQPLRAQMESNRALFIIHSSDCPMKTTGRKNGEIPPIAPSAAICCWILTSRALCGEEHWQMIFNIH